MSEEYYSSRYLNPKDTKDPTKDFLSCSTDNIHSSTKEKLALCKADVQKNTLSDEEFRKHFEWELMQKNIGNCYLVAVINSLRLHTDFKKLIQKSVKKVPDGFEFTLPLGAPYPYWKVVKVTERDYYPQLTIGAKELIVLDGNDWLKALAIAYWKISTGQDEYDTRLLTGWNEVNVMNTMFYWISGYSRSRDKFTYDKNDKIVWNKKEDTPFVIELKNVLDMFNRGKLMTVNFPINESDIVDDIFDFRKQPELAWNSLHAFTVHSVVKTGNNIHSVIIINPWDSTKKIKLSIKKFLHLVTSYSLGAYDPRIFWITHNSKKDIWNRSEIDQSENKDLKIKEMGLDQIISKFSRLLYFGRHNCTIRFFGGEYYIDSFWKTDTRLWSGFMHRYAKATIDSEGGLEKYLYKYKFDNYASIQRSVMIGNYIRRGNREWDYSKLEHVIHFGKQRISFGNRSPFSTEFQWKTDTLFAYTLYPALFATFINQCRERYIDKKEERESTILEPFYLDAKWNLSFSDWRVSDNITTFLTNQKYDRTIMSKWSEIWIRSSDIDTKKKIVDLLNRLYKWD